MFHLDGNDEQERLKGVLRTETFSLIISLQNEDRVFDGNNENQTPNDQTNSTNTLVFIGRLALFMEDGF